MHAVPYTKWPKPSLARDTSVVAYIDASLDEISRTYGLQPKIFSSPATKREPEVSYSCLFFLLAGGHPAALTEYPNRPNRLELNLQIVRDEFAYDDDLSEVIRELQLRPEQVRKFEGNFTWLPNRKAKTVRQKEEPIPEDPSEFWAQVKVLPPRD